MASKPKAMLALALGPDKPSDSEEGSLGGSTADALEAMFKAMKSGDFETAAMHFEDAYHSCADDKSDDEEESDPFSDEE